MTASTLAGVCTGCDAIDCPHLTTPAVSAAAHVSYRQVDHWLRCGYIPAPTTWRGGRGTGYARLWTQIELDYVLLLAQLVRVGIRVDSAATAIKAHDHADCTAATHVIALPGAVLHLTQTA